METHDIALNNWRTLNDYLRDAEEDDCRQLLDMELGGQKRKKFVQRIHSRLNRVRAAHERETIEELVGA